MPATAPPVSVLLPARDAAAWLPDAIASLEAQTFGDYEVIAVDDGSRDRTPEVLAEWAARDPRVRTVTLPHSGIVAALEQARALARGTYLARMDADDVALPTRFQRQLELLASDPSIVLCGCRVRYFPRPAVRDGARRYEEWLNACTGPDEHAREVFVECPIAHPTFFMRAEAVASVGGYRDEGIPEDYDLLLRLWGAGGGIAKVPEVLLHWRERAGRLSRVDPRYAPAAFRACKARHLLEAFPRAAADGVVVWGAGPVGKALARALTDAGGRVCAFAEVDPRKIGQEVHGAPVLDTEGALSTACGLHLAAVGQPGARKELRQLLSAAGKVELRDFVAVA